MKYTWEYSENEEIWRNDIFDTVEDCILDAKENYCVESGTDIAVGEVVPWEPYVMATDILERLEEEAYDEVGEVGGDWNAFNYNKDKEKLEELSDKITEIVKQWLKDNGTYPDFYRIENVEIVKVE